MKAYSTIKERNTAEGWRRGIHHGLNLACNIKQTQSPWRSNLSPLKKINAWLANSKTNNHPVTKHIYRFKYNTGSSNMNYEYDTMVLWYYELRKNVHIAVQTLNVHTNLYDRDMFFIWSFFSPPSYHSFHLGRVWICLLEWNRMWNKILMKCTVVWFIGSLLLAG